MNTPGRDIDGQEDRIVLSTVAPLDIVGFGLVSGAGVGGESLKAALDAGWVEPTDLAEAGVAGAGTFPKGRLRPVPDLDLKGRLGPKGLRAIDRTGALGLVTAKLALDSLPGGLPPERRKRTGVVLGTSAGGIRSISEYGRETVVNDPPYLVSPEAFPNTMLNGTASRIAIRNSLNGVNATVAGGQMAGLMALRYARVTIGAGRAERLLVGGVEELSPQLAWAWKRSRALSPRAGVGEGCALFVVEEAARVRERDVPAQLLACEVRFRPTGPGLNDVKLAYFLGLCIERALERSGVAPDEVTAVSLGSTGPYRQSELDGVRFALGALPRTQVEVSSVVGETYSASGALQLAGLLTRWQSDGAEPGEVGLVTSVDHDGSFGCQVVRAGRGGLG